MLENKLRVSASSVTAPAALMTSLHMSGWYGEAYAPSHPKVQETKKMNKRIMVCSVAALLLAGIRLQAGRPLTTDDADPTDQGGFEFEAGVGYAEDAESRLWELPVGLAYGLLPGLEVGIGWGLQAERSSDESGISDVGIGAKWQAVSACPLGARHALAVAVNLPAADEDKGLGSGETDADLTWIISRSICEKGGLHVNVGYTWIGGEDDSVHAGIAFDYQLFDALQWVVEVFGERELISGAETITQFNTGLRWNPSENLTLDLAGGSKLSDEGPDLTATAGLTLAFGN